MVQWMSEWLREIIIIILLAVFVDLLLPNNTMQRYVKVVLSLFILMTILSPIISLFKENLTFGDWENEVIDVSAYESLEHVMETGGRIRASNEKHSLQLIEARLARQMKEELDQVMPGQIHAVTVKASVDENRLDIQQVQVTLLPSSERSVDSQVEEEASFQDEFFLIEPIQSVVINIEIDHINEEHVLSSKGDQVESNKREQNSKISHILEQNWHVSSKQLLITYVEEVSSLFKQEVSSWGSSYKNWSNGWEVVRVVQSA